MPKPTYASVTEELCTCGYLQNAADDPDNPIVFDAATGEYQFSYIDPNAKCEGRAMLVIYHCPFCGGAVPASKRALLFAVVPRMEEERLAGMMAPITTMKEALATLGTPDFEGHSTTRGPEREGEPFEVIRHRKIMYRDLSDVAELWITERADGTVWWRLQGKYIGT